MKVELIQGTENAVKLLADIASICYGKEEASNPKALIENLIKLGHMSVFEHAFYTFKIEGISRACLGQLVRHRHASYTVRSQRYCDESEATFIIPQVVHTDIKVYNAINDALDSIEDSYDELIELGVKREDARSILPMATSTELYMTLNLRELLHIVSLRTASDAQNEIKSVVKLMRSAVRLHDKSISFVFNKREEL